MTDSTKFSLSPAEENYINSIIEKVADEKKKSTFRIIGFEEFYALFNKDEVDLIKRLLDIDPAEYGFRGTYFGIEQVPNDLVEIVDQKYNLDDKIETLEAQYLPKQVYLAYLKLNESLYEKAKKRLLVLSGYRSPAYQVFVFLWYFKFYAFDLQKTIRRAALPGYSEHGFPDRQAIDFITENGSPTEANPEDFENTTEYKWLVENADKFNFYLTNPRNNTLGTMYEPWHWAHIKA